MHCEADAFYNEIILSPYIFSVNTVTEEWKRVPNRLLHMLFSMAGLVWRVQYNKMNLLQRKAYANYNGSG